MCNSMGDIECLKGKVQASMKDIYISFRSFQKYLFFYADHPYSAMADMLNFNRMCLITEQNCLIANKHFAHYQDSRITITMSMVHVHTMGMAFLYWLEPVCLLYSLECALIKMPLRKKFIF